MPTTNPRINVTVSQSLYQLTGDLARLQRVSRSTVLRELLEASEPALRQVVAMMAAADELSSEMKGKLSADLGRALGSVEKKAQELLSVASGATADLVAEAEAIKGRRPAGGGRRAGTRPTAANTRKRSRTPLSSNRGVKS